MKKLLAMILAAAACMSMAACGKSEASGKQPAASEVVSAVAEKLVFVDNMTSVSGDLVFDFLMLDKEKVADAQIYTSGSRATAEEVTVIKMKDVKDVQLAQTALAQRIEDQKLAYENYMPEEMPKLEGAVTCTHGAYLLLVIADDPSKAEETFNAQF